MKFQNIPSICLLYCCEVPFQCNSQMEFKHASVLKECISTKEVRIAQAVTCFLFEIH